MESKMDRWTTAHLTRVGTVSTSDGATAGSGKGRRHCRRYRRHYCHHQDMDTFSQTQFDMSMDSLDEGVRQWYVHE